MSVLKTVGWDTDPVIRACLLGSDGKPHPWFRIAESGAHDVNGVLEQAWQLPSGRYEWRPIPRVNVADADA